MGRVAIEVPSGTRFGQWVVDRELTANQRGQRQFLCKCTCGSESSVLLLNLRRGRSKGCRNCCRGGRRVGPMSESEKARRRFKRELHVAELKEFGII